MPPADLEDLDTPVTLGEIGRNLARLNRTVDGLSEKVEQYPKWPDLQRVEAGLLEKIMAAASERRIQLDAQQQRIADLEAWQTWAVRIILGLVVTAILGAIFVVKPG